eukprot:885317-Prorocentrum_minimum.AAC.2
MLRRSQSKILSLRDPERSMSSFAKGLRYSRVCSPPGVITIGIPPDSCPNTSYASLMPRTQHHLTEISAAVANALSCEYI